MLTKANAANPYDGTDPYTPGPVAGTAVLPPSSAPSTLSGSKSWATGSVANGATGTTTLTVPGARTGDPLRLAVTPTPPASVAFRGDVTANDTVTLVVANNSGASFAGASYNVTVEVFPAAQQQAEDDVRHQ